MVAYRNGINKKEGTVCKYANSDTSKMHCACANELQQSSTSESLYAPALSSSKHPFIARSRVKLYVWIFSMVLIIGSSLASLLISAMSLKESRRIENMLETHLLGISGAMAGSYVVASGQGMNSNTPVTTDLNNGDQKQNATAIKHRPQQSLASAHVSGATISNEREYAVISDWSVTNSSDSFSVSIQHRRGHLVVLVSGLYYIYSAVQFLNYPADDPLLLGSTHAQLSHSVWRWNVVYPNDGNKLVMRRSETARWNVNTDVDERASYLGGVHALRAGDEVFVRLSRHGVRNDTKSTFFGMFAVSGQY